MHVRTKRSNPLINTTATLGLTGILAACAATPPVTISLPDQQVKLSDMWSGAGAASSGSSQAVIPGLPDVVPQLGQLTGITYFPVPMTPGGLPVNLPSEVRTVPVAAASLNLTTTNNYPIPLELRIFLSGSNPFQNDTSPSVLDMGAKGSPTAVATASHAVDPSLLKASTLAVGFGLSSTGSGGHLVTFDSDATVDIQSSITVSFKLPTLGL